MLDAGLWYQDPGFFDIRFARLGVVFVRPPGHPYFNDQNHTV